MVTPKFGVCTLKKKKYSALSEGRKEVWDGFLVILKIVCAKNKL